MSAGIGGIESDGDPISTSYVAPGGSGRVAASLAQIEGGAPAMSGANSRQQKLQKAAEQFESMLLSSLWKSMKTAFGDDEEDSSDPAGGALEDWGMEAMSGAVGKAGGLGIGRLIIQSLEPKIAAPRAKEEGRIGNAGAKGWAESADKGE